MLRLARALGFIAPLAVAACSLTLAVIMTRPGEVERELLIALVVIALLAGMTTTALLAWSYFGWRLNGVAMALEAALTTTQPTRMRETGIPAERRLARAFNAAAGSYALVEARATHDRLTGIPNRETLYGALMSAVQRAQKGARPLSVAFIDIDRFKPINDSFGHNSGDLVLRQVASLISANIRKTDLFGRYGGEEFMLILPDTVPDHAVMLAEKLRTLVMRHSVELSNGESVRVTISSGIAGGLGAELDADDLVERADAAMYAAKSLGRNRTYLFRDLNDEAPVRRAPISPEHRAAATAIGRWASDTATQALASVLAPQPHHRGRPSDMIAALAMGIGVEMGLPDDEIERIRIASLLHDLGKLAVPTEILDKPSELSDGEWQAIGEHPRIGQVILEQASALREAIPVVLHHHERWNGGGYPHGLRGNEIPLGARIVAVADAYHAMVHDRPYKERLGHEAALAELRRNAGSQFDPEVVEIFCSTYAAKVPPDGLEEVYRLHNLARDGLSQIGSRAHTHEPDGHTHEHVPTRLSSPRPAEGAV